jgi:hypothetical protein
MNSERLLKNTLFVVHGIELVRFLKSQPSVSRQSCQLGGGENRLQCATRDLDAAIIS